jgi:1-acyl-sn-glycerol-3-phosphate acyltransferase
MIPIQPIVLWGTSGSLFEKKVQKPSKKFYVSFLLYKKPFDFHSHNITWFIEEIRNEMENEYKRISVCVEQNKTVYKS